MTRATDSHDAGMQAHDAELPRDTYTSDFWITRSAWLAGWDEAAELKANPPADWSDVAVSLPTRAIVDAVSLLIQAHDEIVKVAKPKCRLASDWISIAQSFGCDSFFAGHHLVIYSPGNHSRFCVAIVGTCANGQVVGDIV